MYGWIKLDGILCWCWVFKLNWQILLGLELQVEEISWLFSHQWGKNWLTIEEKINLRIESLKFPCCLTTYSVRGWKWAARFWQLLKSRLTLNIRRQSSSGFEFDWQRRQITKISSHQSVKSYLTWQFIQSASRGRWFDSCWRGKADVEYSPPGSRWATANSCFSSCSSSCWVTLSLSQGPRLTDWLSGSGNLTT